MLQVCSAIQILRGEKKDKGKDCLVLLSGFQVDICSLTLILKPCMMRFPVSAGISFTLLILDLQGNISSGETARIHKLLGNDHPTRIYTVRLLS